MKPAIPVALLLTAAAVGLAALGLRSDTGAAIPEYTAPTLPSRTSVTSAGIPEPPELPKGADALLPIIFTVTTTWDGPHGQRRATERVTRTADRVHVVMDDAQKEWLFERNPVDPRRVSGYLVDHASRQILTYQESDLRAEQHLRGWADALMMRFDPGVLPGLQRTNQHDIVFDATFTRYAALDATREGVVDVSWSDALLLPLRLKIRRRGVTITSTIDRLASPDTLADVDDPRKRFQGYTVLDVTDSRERSH